MKPSVSRIVHYVMPNGKHRAAMIVAIVQDTVNLQVFLDGPNDQVPAHQGTVWRNGVVYNEVGIVGTWHWPERVDE